MLNDSENFKYSQNKTKSQPMLDKRFSHGHVGGVKLVSYGHAVLGDPGHPVDLHARVVNHICCGVIPQWHLKSR